MPAQGVFTTGPDVTHLVLVFFLAWIFLFCICYKLLCQLVQISVSVSLFHLSKLTDLSHALVQYPTRTHAHGLPVDVACGCLALTSKALQACPGPPLPWLYALFWFCLGEAFFPFGCLGLGEV